MATSKEANRLACLRWRETHREQWNAYQRDYYRFRRRKAREEARQRYHLDPERVLERQRAARRVAAEDRAAEERAIMRAMEAMEADACRIFMSREPSDAPALQGRGKRISAGLRVYWAMRRKEAAHGA